MTRARGFSLVELMIAMAITATIGAMTVGSFAQIDRASQAARAQGERYAAARLALSRIPGSFFFEALRRAQPTLLVALEAAGAVRAARDRTGLRVLLGPVAVSFLVLTFVQIGPTSDWLDSRYLGIDRKDAGITPVVQRTSAMRSPDREVLQTLLRTAPCASTYARRRIGTDLAFSVFLLALSASHFPPRPSRLRL